ncbi:MAG: hypothetical protein QXG57_04780 [Thermofilaceae archaeon]
MRVTPLLVAALALTQLALAQPFPVSVKVDASVQGFYGPLTYRVTVTASRQVDVRVRVSVIVPGGPQLGWKTLWEGRMGEGETRVIESREDSVPRLGSYVIWVAVDFTSPRDFMVIDSRYYYATYDMIHVVTVYEPSAEHWRNLYLQALNESERCKVLYGNASATIVVLNAKLSALEAQLAGLEQSYRSLWANYTQLQDNYSALTRELAAARFERDALREALRREEERSRTLLTLAIALAALSTLTAAVLALQIARRRWVGAPPPPPPRPLKS